MPEKDFFCLINIPGIYNLPIICFIWCDNPFVPTNNVKHTLIVIISVLTHGFNSHGTLSHPWSVGWQSLALSLCFS